MENCFTATRAKFSSCARRPPPPYKIARIEGEANYVLEPMKALACIYFLRCCNHSTKLIQRSKLKSCVAPQNACYDNWRMERLTLHSLATLLTNPSSIVI